jgi:Flp pilus assembly pilin Flp
MTMLMQRFRDQRGVVSVEWIILAIIIMGAIVVAFGPTLQAAFIAGIQAVSSLLSAQAGS